MHTIKLHKFFNPSSGCLYRLRYILMFLLFNSGQGYDFLKTIWLKMLGEKDSQFSLP
jgi:hypothetical protein